MLRLVEHGFLRTEKKGRERTYWPTVEREDYLRFETENFLKLYHENSLAGFVNTLDGTKKISDAELDRLQKWLDEKKMGN